MTRCTKAKRFMMEQLFGEITPTGAAELELHLEKCPACRAEWQAVQESHAWMGLLTEKPIPYPLEQHILLLAQTEPSEPIPHSWRWRRPLAIAAVFLLLLCASVEYFRPRTQSTGTERYAGYPITPALQKSSRPAPEESSMKFFSQEKIAGIQKEKSQAPSPDVDQRITAGVELSVPEKPDTNLAVQAGDLMVQAGTVLHAPQPTAVMLAGREMRVTAARTEPVVTNEKEAEDLFRTGLKLYNRAFTKVGEERNAMLKSAIVFLRDGIQRYSTHRLWVSLSLILIADSHRALGETEAALQAYQQMIDRFPELVEYGKHARSSMITLLSQNPQSLPKAEIALSDFVSRYPQSPEFPEMAFAVADQIRPASPRQALFWYQQVLHQTSYNDPAKDKAERLTESLEAQLREQNQIKDWWIVGPMERNSQWSDLPGYSAKYLRFRTNLKSIGYKQKPVAWKRPFPGEHGEVDVAAALGQTPNPVSAFAVTNVYSPIKQGVVLQISGTDGLKIWMNGDPIFSRFNPNLSQEGLQNVETFLRQGWNQITVQTYHLQDRPEWKFMLQINDLDGHIIPDLIVNPEQNK